MGNIGTECLLGDVGMLSGASMSRESSSTNGYWEPIVKDSEMLLVTLDFESTYNKQWPSFEPGEVDPTANCISEELANDEVVIALSWV